MCLEKRFFFIFIQLRSILKYGDYKVDIFMCFSASASFITAGLLIPTGIISIYRALKARPNYLMLALIPIFFGLQQISEGIVWLTLEHQNLAFAHIAAMFFLFFAIWVWPSYFAFSIFLTEKSTWKRYVLLSLSILGIIFGALLYLPILQGKIPLNLSLQTHAICYDIDIYTKVLQGYSLIYLALILTSTLISSHKLLQFLGSLILLSFVASYVWFSYAFTSVWCFFAALLSALILAIIYSEKTT